MSDTGSMDLGEFRYTAKHTGTLLLSISGHEALALPFEIPVRRGDEVRLVFRATDITMETKEGHFQCEWTER